MQLLRWSTIVRQVRDRARAGGTAGGRASVAANHRDDIQGLRAIAVVLVVAAHAGVGFLGGGYVGVDVFFVLSGFLITGLLLHGAERRGYVSFFDFYVRRAKRILPAATLTLVVTTIASYHLLNYVRAKQVVWDSLWASFFFANVRFARQGTDYFTHGQPPSPIQHYWSLSVEEQFYFVWPALLALVLFAVALGSRSGARRRSRGEPVITVWGVRRLVIVVAVVGAASLAWSVHYTGIDPTAAYFSTFARGWELALGAVLAIGATRVARLPPRWRTRIGWLGLAAIGAAALTYSDATAFPGYAALLPTVGTAFVIAAGLGTAQPRFGVGRALSTLPLRYVGDRSYAFYLWHWPVLVIAAQYTGHDLSVGVNLAFLLGAFLLSVVSYGLFENPIRRARWKVSWSAALVPASIAAIAVVAAITLTSIDAKVPTCRSGRASRPESLAGPAAHRRQGRSQPGAAGSRSSGESCTAGREDPVGAEPAGRPAPERQDRVLLPLRLCPRPRRANDE